MPTIRPKDYKKKTRKENISQKYYNKTAWKVLRNSFIHDHPLCQLCLQEGKVTPAEHVHHKVPFLTGTTEGDRLKLLLDQDNLMSLCRKCHILVHKKRN